VNSATPLKSCLGRLDLRRLFASSVAKSSESPLHLEICSGSGEWLSSQALSLGWDFCGWLKVATASHGFTMLHTETIPLTTEALRDPNTNWMACELRFDRSARCFQRFALRELTQAANVGIIVGDAQNALENHLKKGWGSFVLILETAILRVKTCRSCNGSFLPCFLKTWVP